MSKELDNNINHIMAVVDPTTSRGSTLKRSFRMAKTYGSAKVTAYLCIYSSYQVTDRENLIEVEKDRHQLWLQKHIADMDTEGVEYDIVIDWDKDWEEAIPAAAQRLAPDLVVKASHRRSAGSRKGILRRRSTEAQRKLRTSDRRLIRNATCPILFVKGPWKEAPRKLLVAMDLSTDEEAYKKLDERVLEFGKAFVSRAPDREMHVVNAAESWDKFVHPPDLAKAAGIEREFAHIAEGSPTEVIAQVAEEIDANLLVIGTVGRSGAAGLRIGNTAERILDRVQMDTLVLTVPEQG